MSIPNSNCVAFPTTAEHLRRLRMGRPGTVDPIYLGRLESHSAAVEALVGWGLGEQVAHDLVVEIKANTIPHLYFRDEK